MVGAEAADQRPGHRGEPEGRTDQAHVAAAGPGRDEIGDDRLDADHEPAAAGALDRAEGDEFVHAPRPARQRRAGGEDEEGEEEDGLAAEEITELAVERQSDGGGQEVGRHRPGHRVQAVQFADDLRERGGHDGLVEGGEQQRRHQPGEDQAHAAGAGRRHRGGAGARAAGPVVHGRPRRRCRGARCGRTGPLDPFTQGGPAHVLLPSSRLLPPNFSHWATTPIKRGEWGRAGRERTSSTVRSAPLGLPSGLSARRRAGGPHTSAHRKPPEPVSVTAGVRGDGRAGPLTSPSRGRGCRGARRRSGRAPWGRRSSRRSRRRRRRPSRWW